MEATVYVAIPSRLVEAISSPQRGAEVDLSALIEEWAAGFVFPTETLVKHAPRLLTNERGWKLRARAVVTPSTTRLLRDVATDPAVLNAVEASELGWLVERDELRPEGTCLLLGLAAVAALEAEVGREARRLNAEAARRAEVQSARQQSDAPTGPTRPTLGSL